MSKSVLLAVIALLMFGLSSTVCAQEGLLNRCDTPPIVFSEYDETNNKFPLRCLSNGQVITLLSHAGTGELSPSEDFIAYISLDGETDTMSLHLYDVNSNVNTVLRQGDGHIAVNWVSTNKLIISTWSEPITHISEISRPNYRALYDPETASFTQLFWPEGVTEFHYLPDQGRFVLRNLSYGVFSIGSNGMFQPIELPYIPDGTAPLAFDVSENGSTAIYGLQCSDPNYFSCFAVYDMQTGGFELNDVFQQKEYWAINRLSLSSTTRFVAFDLDQHQLGVYDLNEQQIVFLETEQVVNGYRWIGDKDVLIIATSAEISGMSYLYELNATTGELQLVFDSPVRWIDFY